MKFEKRPRKVIYVKPEDIYRATADTVTSKIRTPKDSRKSLVGIAAAITFWDNVDKRSHCLGCARAIKEAWIIGDRYLLDTDDARKAAELVADLADTKPDEDDLCSALIDLMNAIAKVRMSNTSIKEFDVLSTCSSAIKRCYEIEGFKNWSAQAKRRRFLYELPRKDRTTVTYTLMGLYFNHGATPLLTSKQRQELLSLDRGDGPDGAISYFDNCLRHMTSYLF